MTLSTLEKMASTLNIEPHEIFQFISLQSNEDMFNYLNQKINSIKEDNEKLKTVYNILKNIL